jgi:4-azaleucine resistance transporter AzlC
MPQYPSRTSEFLAGIRGQLPLLLGVAPFGTAYGAYAIETGLSGGMTQAMSAIVFGGASQFIAVQLIGGGVPGAMIVLAVLLVNARHMLYGASLAPHVSHLNARWRWVLAYLLTDEAYAVGMQRYGRDDESPRKHWFLFGSGFALWSTWQVTTAAGIFLGAALPESWSLDFALPLTFIALLIPVLTNRPAFAAAGVAGLIAVVGFGWPYATELIVAIVGGLVAGMLTQRLLRERRLPA